MKGEEIYVFALYERVHRSDRFTHTIIDNVLSLLCISIQIRVFRYRLLWLLLNPASDMKFDIRTQPSYGAD